MKCGRNSSKFPLKSSSSSSLLVIEYSLLVNYPAYYSEIVLGLKESARV